MKMLAKITKGLIFLICGLVILAELGVLFRRELSPVWGHLFG